MTFDGFYLFSHLSCRCLVQTSEFSALLLLLGFELGFLSSSVTKPNELQPAHSKLSCGRARAVPFQINDPRTWSFCNMGICLSEECSCFRNFQGAKCSKFQGKCWLYYCFLIGCKFELPSLHCVCDPSLYGQIVTSKIYFYDHGIENAYLPFPEDFVMVDVVEAPVIQETESGSYEIIGGNSHKSLTTGVSHRKRKNIPYDQEFTFNIQKRNENFLRHNPFLRYPVKKSIFPKDEHYGNQYMHSKRRPFRNYKSKKIKEINPNDFYGNNFKQNSEIRPDSYEAYDFKTNFGNKFQRNWNEPPNYRRIRNGNSGYDFHKASFPYPERNEGFFNENRKSIGRSKTFRSLDFEDGASEEEFPESPVFSQSELTDDWEHNNQYMNENILPKSNTNSRALIKPMEEFYEKQPKRAIRSELSTVRVLWSDSEMEDGKIVVISRIISLIIQILKKKL
ncbi:hypothetical protein CDAR_231651 [Caerostris darwini]|uniref:Uncharacterized protein n=1 Tax=Caerostris darwini TaxID=1538125 RepID=A0AAV4X6F5_9ARAC|nr:hypothetical protein CDAR_231651 [Caerostris darwini]